MSATEDADRIFNEELTALERFFERRADEHEHFRLGRQDPDVRRIIEAVAFFSARTRMLAAANVRRAVERVVRGQLDYLLTPMPTAGLMQIRVDGLAGPATLPRATEVRVEAPDRSVALFTTTRPIALLPIQLGSAKVQLVGERYHLVLELNALVALRGPLAPLSFLVDYRGSYRDSLRLFSALEAHVRRARVSFDEDDFDEGIDVGCWFGAPDAAAGGPDDDGMHPIARVRSFFHFPNQDLFLNVALPSRSRHWSRAFVHLELDGDLPAELFRVSEVVLQPFVVPIANLRCGDSETMTCDGTKDVYPIRDSRLPLASAEREAKAVLCAVDGVYRVTDRGREPIPPGLLSEAGPVYELVFGGSDPDAATHQLALNIPGAFAKPCKVVVAARWYQPSFDVHAAGRLTASLQSRRLEGTSLSIRGDLALHRTSALWDDALGLLHVLSLKTNARLSRDQLMMLARCAGADKKSLYRRLPELVRDVRVSEAPENGGRGTIRYVYELVWKQEDPDFDGLHEDGLVAQFEARVASLLEAWLADEVELRRFDDVARRTTRSAVQLTLTAGAVH